jgi:hypothetical protein
MKEARLKRKPAAVGPAYERPRALDKGTPGPEDAEGGDAPLPPKPPRKAKASPALPVGPETRRLLLERQRTTREFKRRQDMGEWAAELLLALPPHSHTLSPQARAELFRRMREWCASRGLA